MPRPEAFRGEVWDVDLPDVGTHPAVVRSVDPMDAGLTRYDESYADVTGLRPVARERLPARRGLLSPSGLERLGRRLTVYLEL